MLIVLAVALPARAQLGADRLAALRARGMAEGWTFTVSDNPATRRPAAALCGLIPPAEVDAGVTLPASPRLRGPLPDAFDWRAHGGCPPVRDQGLCGSCWAFATVGVLECNIQIVDGDTVDLSEQWLVSCNRSGYGCDGGWWAHAYHLSATDACGGTGAVLEADFPYVQSDAACACPYPHAYTIDGWGYVGSSDGVPPTDDIKQAILDYGPVAAAVYVDAAFTAYDDGIFNASAPGIVNHAIVLVGWDDNDGNGYWILRNSWSDGWGEDGYMRIAYGCSSVGYGATAVLYSGAAAARIEVTPASPDFGDVSVGDAPTLAVTVKNVDTDPLVGSASGLAAPFSIVSGADYNLAAGESQIVTLRFEPAFLGEYSDTLEFTGGGGAFVVVSGSGTGTGVPADECGAAPTIAEGTYLANNATAGTHATASCGGGGSADVWWRYVATASGAATIDTAGSDFDTVLSVYDACDGDELACNDDDGGLASSRVTFNVLSGQGYRVSVAGVAGQTGNIALTIDVAPNPVAVSGRVVDPTGAGVAGVVLAGLPGLPRTDTDGRFSAEVEYGFTGTAVPQCAGWAFTPASRSYNTLTSNIGNQNYTAAPIELTIRGRITDASGAGLPGVTVGGLPGDVRSDTDGLYTAVVPYGFIGNAVPQLAGYGFEPAGRAYAGLTEDAWDEDYVAARQLGDLQVLLQPAEILAAARWRVDGGAWRSGGETARGLLAGLHVIEYADVPGYTAPPRETRTVLTNETAVVTRSYTAARARLTVHVEPPGSGTVIADPAAETASYSSGTQVRLLAVPSHGYRTSAWVGVDAVGADDGSVAFVLMDKDRAVTVTFDPALTGERDDEVLAPPSPIGMPCGGGGLGLLPLTLLGLVWLRRAAW